MWTKLPLSKRGMWCATEGCWGVPTHQLEVEGVRSEYCTDCASTKQPEAAALPSTLEDLGER